MKKRRSKHVRRLELFFWALGSVLLGIALGATWDRWHYQAEQERALFNDAPESSPRNAAVETPLSEPVADLVGPIEMIGPPSPPLTIKPDVPPALAPKPKERRAAIADPTAFGRIEIPRIGVRAIVRKGADEKTLARAVGLVPGAPNPGEGGNVVLAGHRDTFFRPLRRIKVNDRIRLVVPPNEYEYRVDSLRVVSPEETDVLESKGEEELTLVTCYPFRYIGSAPDRFIVSATRVN